MRFTWPSIEASAFTEAGDYLRCFGDNDLGKPEGLFVNGDEDLCVVGCRVFVTDYGNNCVAVLSLVDGARIARREMHD